MPNVHVHSICRNPAPAAATSAALSMRHPRLQSPSAPARLRRPLGIRLLKRVPENLSRSGHPRLLRLSAARELRCSLPNRSFLQRCSRIAPSPAETPLAGALRSTPDQAPAPRAVRPPAIRTALVPYNLARSEERRVG